MKEIITALILWISANTYYNTDHPLPNIVFLSQEEMNSMYYKDNDHEPNSLHGMYDKDNDLIILPDTWDGREPWDLGVLLHEMIHYYQDMNEMVSSNENDYISYCAPSCFCQIPSIHVTIPFKFQMRHSSKLGGHFNLSRTVIRWTQLHMV